MLCFLYVLSRLIMIRTINCCLTSQLLDIYQQAMQLDRLNSMVRENLSSPLADNCQVGSFNKGCLVLTTANAAWATELRYNLSELRDKLRTAGLYQLTAIKIAVTDYEEGKIANKERTKAQLSLSARDNIRRIGELCTYPPLQAALYHLADGGALAPPNSRTAPAASLRAQRSRHCEER